MCLLLSFIEKEKRFKRLPCEVAVMPSKLNPLVNLAAGSRRFLLKIIIMLNSSTTNQERKPIGFKFYETSEVAVITEPKQEQSQEVFPSNPYLEALLKSVNEFLKEEIKGNSFTELRLMKKIESARVLFGEEKSLLCKTHKSLL